MFIQTEWKHLERRPEKQTRQLCIRGRNMKVWHLVQPIVVGGRTPEEMAEDYRLPIEAVNEALEYYRLNEALILEEVEEEERQAALRDARSVL